MSDEAKRKLGERAKAAKAKPYENPDGIERSLKEEQDINQIFAAAFGTDAADKAMQYLKNITLNRVSGPGVPDSELRHLEGQRYIVSIILRRIEDGRNRRPE
jgi:hypothetical protein